MNAIRFFWFCLLLADGTEGGGGVLIHRDGMESSIRSRRTLSDVKNLPACLPPTVVPPQKHRGKCSASPRRCCDSVNHQGRCIQIQFVKGGEQKLPNTNKHHFPKYLPTAPPYNAPTIEPYKSLNDEQRGRWFTRQTKFNGEQYKSFKRKARCCFLHGALLMILNTSPKVFFIGACVWEFINQC